jgi:3D (Asp-Asp-Asp) domain-containing protein
MKKFLFSLIAVVAISTAIGSSVMAEEMTVDNDRKPEDIQLAAIKPSNSAEAAVKEEIKVEEQIIVAATAYTAECEGCSGTTKTGINLRENPDEKVIAVDPDIIPLGSKVYVEGYGYAVAGDIGGGINGHEIDIFLSEEQDAVEWGRQQVKVAIVEE